MVVSSPMGIRLWMDLHFPYPKTLPSYHTKFDVIFIVFCTFVLVIVKVLVRCLVTLTFSKCNMTCQLIAKLTVLLRSK